MELWEIVDGDGVPTGKFCKRSERDTIPAGFYHAVVEVWVRVNDRILLTQRHPDKWAGLLWEASGGAVVSGERVTSGACRELHEETGISVEETSLIPLGRSIRGKSLIISYMVRLGEIPDITLQECEVVDYKFVSCREILALGSTLTEGTRERLSLYKDALLS